MRYLAILAFFFTSCGSSETLPEGVLSKEKMIKVLTAVHIAEAEQQQRVLDQLASPSDTFSFQDVFKKQQINRAEYENSMKFYSANPELLDQIYDEVINELSRKQAEEMKKKQ
jgi:hypothetical protein